MSFKDKILNNQSPWGSPPGGGRQGSPGGNGSGTRQDPPNLDDIIKNFQKTTNYYRKWFRYNCRRRLYLDCFKWRNSSETI